MFDRALVVVLAFMFGLFGWLAVDSRQSSSRLSREGMQAKRALCTFRADLAGRVENSERFLAEHPGDIDLGSVRIARAQVINQVANQKATLRSLDDLNC